MPPKSKLLKKHAKKTAPATSAGSSPSKPVMSAAELKKRATEMRKTAKTDGLAQLEAFWANLNVALQEAEKGVSPTLANAVSSKLAGIQLRSVDETNQAVNEVKEWITAKKNVESENRLTELIIDAPLDESIMAELYHLRAKMRFETKKYMDAVRDASFAIALGNNPAEALHLRMNCYLSLGLTPYAKVDYDRLAEENPEYPELQASKSKVTAPVSSKLNQLARSVAQGNLPPSVTLSEAAQATILAALQHDWGFEELAGWIVEFRTRKPKCLSQVNDFGRFLFEVFGATALEDISEVFTHIIPEWEVPMEYAVDEVMDALAVLGTDVHITHQIGYSLCFALAWTSTGFWNLYSHLFASHMKGRYEFQRQLWKEYYDNEIRRIKDGDCDVSFTCNEGIGEIHPNGEAFDFLYYADHGASDFIRLHAVAAAHNKNEVLKELESHAPINPFYVTHTPIIFAAARDAMPSCTQFIIERGATVNLIDAAEETPLDACRIALRFRKSVARVSDIPTNTEAYKQTEQILKDSGAKSNPGHGGHEDDEEDVQSAFERMMFGGGGSDDGEDMYWDDDEDDEDDDESSDGY